MFIDRRLRLIERDTRYIPHIKNSVDYITDFLDGINKYLADKTLDEIQNKFKVVNQRIDAVETKLIVNKDEIQEALSNLEEVIIDFKTQVKRDSLRVWHFKKGMLPKDLVDQLSSIGIDPSFFWIHILKALRCLLNKNKNLRAYPSKAFKCKYGPYPKLLKWCLLKCKKSASCEVKVY